MTVSQLPLAGIRVLEFTHAVMGPVAGQILADLGAEVIRIEPAPNGDRTRRLKGFGLGYHTLFNRNKKSLPVNLKTGPGMDIAHMILPTADVLIENFGPGAMDRLGLGHPDLKTRYPRLIYCALKGFMNGPYQNRAALDEVVQMMSGLAYMTGPPGQPLRAGASVVDIMAGTFGALGVLIALREREKTGLGSLVQNGLFETAAFIMGQHMAAAAISQQPVPPMSTHMSPWAVYRPFETQNDELVFIAITSDKHWQQFCAVFNRTDLLTDPGLKTNNQRVEAHSRLHPILEAQFAELPLSEIIEKCEAARIPYAPIARPEDLFEDPHLNQGNGLVSATLPDGRTARLPRLPLAIHEERYGLYREAPELGEHTRALLQELGYSQVHIDRLHAAEIIVALPQEPVPSQPAG